MIRVDNIKLELEHSRREILQKACQLLHVPIAKVKNWNILKRSLDARDKESLLFVYSISLDLGKHEKYLLQKKRNISLYQAEDETVIMPPYPYMPNTIRPIVFGMGPGGIFATLILARAGLRPLLIEMGKMVEDRQKDVAAFFQSGQLNPGSNIQFGEGGAGTFSDGKLQTGIRDTRIRSILQLFVDHGAPADILYDSKPHIGSDYLPKVIKNIRQSIQAAGGSVAFQSKLTGLELEGSRLRAIQIDSPEGQQVIEAERLILAIGQSARDTQTMLYQAGVSMQAKAFSVGLRIEHSQSWLNSLQYGEFAQHPALGAADYKVSCHLETGRSVYSFCMCPGGQVLAAASEPGQIVTNGMSNYLRDSKNANSALLVGISPKDFPNNHPLAGIELQRQIEAAAFEAGGGNYYAPAQRATDFLGLPSPDHTENVCPSYQPGVTWTELSRCFPASINESLREGLLQFEKKMPGFFSHGAILIAPETRSSSPVRILRDHTLQSNIHGIYPCGEGAGYAGGIISSAVDGLRCAEALLQSYTFPWPEN
jgi:uncharacterized FAD-dependent dehydrogenase